MLLLLLLLNFIIFFCKNQPKLINCIKIEQNISKLRKELGMEKKNDKLTTKQTEKHNVKNYRKDAPGATSGINTPGIDLPAFNPPVPNRAWTAMRMGKDIDQLTEEEKQDMYYGSDGFI